MLESNVLLLLFTPLLSLLSIQSCEDKVSIIVHDMNKCFIYFSTEATIIILGLDFLLIYPGITFKYEGMKVMYKKNSLLIILQ